ncbi:MAG: hypothetical protein ACXAB7_06725 [Candidatus Kariarchaeaceae archaeon]|jgi:hypothetical protein
MDEHLNMVFDLKHSSLSLEDLDPYYFTYVHPETKKQIVIFPQLHDQVVFSKLAAILLQYIKPGIIALELPQQLEQYLIPAIDRLPIPTLVYKGTLEVVHEITYPPHPSSGYIVHPGEPLYWLAHLGRSQGYPVELIDTWHPDSYVSWFVPIDYAALVAIGWAKFWELSPGFVEKHLDSPTHCSRSISMAHQLLEMVTTINEPIIFGCGAVHWPAVASVLETAGYQIQDSDPIPDSIKEIIKQKGSIPQSSTDSKLNEWYLADIHPHSMHIVTSDLPFIIANMVEQSEEFNILESIRNIFFEAETNYIHQFDDSISPASYRRLFQYLRNLGRLQARVLPSLFDMIAAAKGMGDDDYAFEVYRMAVTYPFTPNEDTKLDRIVKFAPDETKGNIIKFAFKRRFRRPVLRKLRKHEQFDDFDPIPEEEFPGQWFDLWEKYSPLGMVSYPPEDVYIENYLNYLRKRINEIVMEEQASSIEFKTSLEDGIDWRATARHFHENKIFVKKIPRKQPEIGALVVQFLEEPYDEDEYSHHSTLFAEHDQESHISVITTQPGETMVGPGITRVKYAAIISQFPPIGWPALIPKTNEDLKIRLLYAAMNMSLSKIIGFVAPKPPSPAHRHYAATNGFRIVYLPMSQLTKASMHRLRTMHLLAHRSLRDNAREYIGF